MEFFLNMLSFFWTLPVLSVIGRPSSGPSVKFGELTLTTREYRERPVQKIMKLESKIYIVIFSKNIIFKTPYCISDSILICHEFRLLPTALSSAQISCNICICYVKYRVIDPMYWAKNHISSNLSSWWLLWGTQGCRGALIG